MIVFFTLDMFSITCYGDSQRSRSSYRHARNVHGIAYYPDDIFIPCSLTEGKVNGQQ